MENDDQPTQQLLAENEELRESEHRYRALAEASPDIIYILDRAGRLLYANRTAASYIGLPPACLVGKTQHDLFPPDKAQQHLERIQRVFETGKALEMEGLYHFGSHDVWLNVRSVPIRDEQGRTTSVMGVCRDVTDKKRAEEALQTARDELERKVKERTAELTIFRRFAEASGQGFGMADMDGLITYMNPALCRIAGATKAEDAIGKPLGTYYPEGYMFRRENEILPAILRAGHWEGELTASIGGKTIYALQNSFLIRDEAGTPARLASVITDITERKRAEEALQTSEEKYKTLVETSPDGVVLADLRGHITFASKRVFEMYGSDRGEDVLGRSPLDFLVAEDHQRFLVNLRRSVEEGVTGSHEYSFLRQDGTQFSGEIAAAVIRDRCGKAHALVAILRDVTEHKRAQEALRQTHDELQAIYNGMADGFLTADVETKRFLRTNPAMCRMLGCSEETILALSVMDIHPAAELPRVLDAFQANAEGRLWIAENIPVLRRDGAVFYADVATSRFEYGGRPCLVGLFRDITERKQAAEALQREHRTLEHMLQSSDHERQLIAYDIHDGLAQYLTGAIMQFDVANQLQTAKPTESAKSYDAGMLMLRQSLAEARRLISGVRPPILDESGIVAAVAHLVYEHRGRTGPKIEFSSKVEFGRLAAVLENSIYRIIQEGLSNAWKHSNSTTVKVGLVQDGENLHIEIQDWGVGFTPTTVDAGRFGLEGIRERARLLGGEAKIESAPGKGTRIVVDLPIALRTEN